MDKVLVLLVSTILSLVVVYLVGTMLVGYFVGFGEPRSQFPWWNISWHYRYMLEVNSTDYERKDWPIEQKVNFTDLLPSGTFDANSIRVFEYSSSGSMLYEVPSQFEPDDDYDAERNAVGTLVFTLNGTNPAWSKRTFFVYYDTLENGGKQAPNYPVNVEYSWDGRNVEINTSFLRINIDTNRFENTTGIYHVQDKGGTVIITVDEIQRTAEYLEYFNGTHNTSFYPTGSPVFLAGPVRLVIKQVGDEVVFGNPSQKTNEMSIIKKYYIYYKAGAQQYGAFIKIGQKLINTAGYTIQRNSTPAGALALDLNRALSSGYIDSYDFNQVDPYSWAWSGGSGGELVGLVNLEEQQTSNYYAAYRYAYGRIGLELTGSELQPASKIGEIALVYFGVPGDPSTEFIKIKNMYASPVDLKQSLPEEWRVYVAAYTNATYYNRGETVLIKGNVSLGDPYNLTKYVNATINMGTIDGSDDQTIILYDDGTNGDQIAGDKVFTNVFTLGTSAEKGAWKINLTAYSINLEFLNSTLHEFQVTDVLNVTVEVENKKPMVGSLVLARVNVKNYRQDSWISGAVINCSYDSSLVENKTDLGNGTYLINFTAPLTEDVFYLKCNATKLGNFGNGTGSFTTEPAKTYISILPQPQNPSVSRVSLYTNDTFAIQVNVTNFGNGTAYDVNVSLELLNNWYSNSSLEKCLELERNGYCVRSFNISVPNGTSPGNYYINVTATWLNPDYTIGFNKSSVNVTVLENPIIEVVEDRITSDVGDGVWNWVGNFTVLSVGNYLLNGISFVCSSGYVCNNFEVKFIPESISSLPVSSSQSVYVNVTVPAGHQPGTYTGTLNITSQNDGFDTLLLNLTIPGKTNVSITPSISYYIAYNITQIDNESFSFQAYATNIGNSSARNLNISLTLPIGWSSNSSIEVCGNILRSEVCTKHFKVTIPEKTSPGNYFVHVRANWTQPDGSLGINTSTITVFVAPNPKISVEEEQLTAEMNAGEEKQIGTFNVFSIGNSPLHSINFICSQGTACQDFTFKFTPPVISTLPPATNQTVRVNVTVPLGYQAGVYTGKINITSQNGGFDTVDIQVTVLENRTWSFKPSRCERSTQFPEGTVCEVNVSNLGNTYINFTVYPAEGNYTKVNETIFFINRGGWRVFKITYNVTDVEPGIYNSTFTIDAVESDANPDKGTVKVSLIPYIPPIVNISVNPAEVEQAESVKIYANVTDRSGSGMSLVQANITRPNGLVDSLNMFLIDTNYSFTRWELTYPNYTGSTDQSGIYKVTVYARDNIGNEETANTSFMVYGKFETFVSTLSDKYYQGDVGSIYFIAYSLGQPVQGVNVNFTIRNPHGNITYASQNFQTNVDGIIIPMPSFSLASDAVLGNYTLTAYATYTDPATGKILEIEKTYRFQVLSRTVTVTGLFADVETSVVWYPSNIMKFGILVYNGEGKPVNPTELNLAVYDPANNLYFSVNLSQMRQMATGYYLYQYAMPPATPSGMFLAVLNVSQNEFQTMKLKAFRVAHGGPYDVRVSLLEHEVEQGSYLDFILSIENKGEVSQDVFVTYWISSQDNITYFTSSEAVLTPALSNQSFTRNAYIFSHQPLGTYYLNVLVFYDPVQPPILANTTFVVIAKVSPPVQNITYEYPVYVPTGAVPMPAPTEKIPASLQITRYKRNVSVARGFSTIEAVTVTNTGEVSLSGLQLTIIGIPVTWFSIVPETYNNISKEDSRVFLVTYSIPKNAKVGEYEINLIATAGVVSDRRTVKLTVFESMEELLRQQISRLKEELMSLEVETRLAEREGKDVSVVKLIIDEIKKKISDAESYLSAGKLEDASESIATATNLLDRAKEILAGLKIEKVRFKLPLWLVLLIAIAVSATIIFAVLLITKKRKISVRPWVIPLGKVADMVRKKKIEEKDKLEKEREKLLRMLEVVEKQKRENVISLTAYNSMKKNIEKRLEEIERKIA